MTSLYTTGGIVVSVYTTGGTDVFGPPSTGGGTGPDSTDPATLTLLRQVGNNTGYHRTVSAVPTDGITITTGHDLTTTTTGVVAQITAIGTAAGSPITAPTVIRRALIVDSTGTAHPALFGGQESVTIQPGSMVRSDPTRDGLVFAAGTRIHTVIEYASGFHGSGTLKGPGENILAVTRGPFSGSIPPSLTNSLSGAPTGLYGKTVPTGRPLAVVGVGDSLMNPGWFRMGAENNGLAWSDWSVWLDTTHVTRDPAADPAMLDRMPATGPIPYDVAFVGWGGNDRNLALDAWCKRSIESYRFFESVGCKVATKTLHPYSTSTDKWSTVEGQTDYNSGADRVPRNDWLRDGAPIDSADNPLPTGTTDTGAIRIGDDSHPLKYPVFDEADVCETARNSGLWKVDGGAWTVDGAHLSAHGNARMADAFTQWVAANLT